MRVRAFTVTVTFSFFFFQIVPPSHILCNKGNFLMNSTNIYSKPRILLRKSARILKSSHADPHNSFRRNREKSCRSLSDRGLSHLTVIFPTIWSPSCLWIDSKHGSLHKQGERLPTSSLPPKEKSLPVVRPKATAREVLEGYLDLHLSRCSCRMVGYPALDIPSGWSFIRPRKEQSMEQRTSVTSVVEIWISLETVWCNPGKHRMWRPGLVLFCN